MERLRYVSARVSVALREAYYEAWPRSTLAKLLYACHNRPSGDWTRRTSPCLGITAGSDYRSRNDWARIGWHRLHILPSPALAVRHASLFFTPDFALPRAGRVPSILTVHDLSFLIHPECADAGMCARICPRRCHAQSCRPRRSWPCRAPRLRR